MEYNRKNIRYTHFRLNRVTGRPGFATVALIRQEPTLANYAVSLCSPLDNFSRQKGRRTAREKWRIGAHTMQGVWLPQSEDRNVDIAQEVLQGVIDNLVVIEKPNRWYASITGISNLAKRKNNGKNSL